MFRWDEETGAVSVYRGCSNYSNGNTRDRQGRLVTCEHGTRSVSRTEWDGHRSVLCDRFNGKRLNSPNDVIVKSDGTIWFTDPTYGILNDYEGNKAERELDGCYVFVWICAMDLFGSWPMILFNQMGWPFRQTSLFCL